MDPMFYDSIRGDTLNSSRRGNLISLLPDEEFSQAPDQNQERAKQYGQLSWRRRSVSGDWFLEWGNDPPRRALTGNAFLLPLILVHVNLDQKRTEEGGEREFVMVTWMPTNHKAIACLAEKLRQDFAIDLPDLDQDGNRVKEYFSRG